MATLSKWWSVSDSFTIKIDSASFYDALSTLQLLKSYLPAHACESIAEGAKQTKDAIVYETVKTLNIDDQRVTDEIESTGDGYKAEIISKGKPIELIDFAIDMGDRPSRGDRPVAPTPKPMNIQIFRTGNTHALRHVFVRNGHLYPGTKPGSKRVNPIKRLHTVRIQDIQAQPDFIDPITKVGADTVIDEYKIAVDEILANV